ncbi:unnamed protein product (macronuclear) [Paramecium tetraurelia]|uniref:t-SNARE coiled-coil homology domain-containing protein n=1 Tax=Paramecium tetraurelia TaxID=5888 RepID=A0CQ80_PARTE|nr:uncharacterized protein GSPATT00009295001 [Paramecium tetraurelia]CAK72947.1 unnamed protein product [Paramecium tetraurelia]|eukprot:XP_001440344.1 hypothetical protein (macronuclear) [Paramecium tetraurelia strain d4-2]
MGNRLPNQENQACIDHHNISQNQENRCRIQKKINMKLKLNQKSLKVFSLNHRLEQEVQVNDIQKLQEQQEDKEVQELIDLANNDFDDLSDQMNKLNCQLEDLQNDLDKYI